MDALALRGVPLAVAPSMTTDDTRSAAYAASQLAFENARGEGTPLLPSALPADDRGPAPYVRLVLTAMLMRHAIGDDPHPIGESEMSAAAEAHLALIEAVSAEAANFSIETVTAPVYSASPSTTRFGAIEYPRPDWLSDTILRSTIRVESVETPRNTGPTSAVEADLLLRLAKESAHWRGIPPHGARDKLTAEGRAAAMSAVAAAPRMNVEPYGSVLDAGTPPPDNEWLRIATLQMVGSVGSTLSSDLSDPTPDGIRLAVLNKMAKSAINDARVERAVVIDASTVADFLSNFDVMRDYVFQPV
jgi:hypothetical protein